MKKFLTPVIAWVMIALMTTPVHAQDWVKMMQDPSVNFFETQKAFYKYYNKAERKIEREKRRLARKSGEAIPEGELEVPGFEQFKRWEYFMTPRVSATGERFAPDAVWNAMADYKSNYNTLGAGNWTFMGPSTVPSNSGGAGRLQFLTVHPTNPIIMWVGSPAGGLWKTTNGGTSWTTNTDQLPQTIGCSDLAIDINNPNTMYLATGDADAGDTYSVGLLKTTDGGNTWNKTGLSYYLPQYKQIAKVLIDPTNSNTLYVATNSGVYKSIDAAATFSLSLSGSFKDIEFQPGTPATLYACGNEFYRTTNSGGTWTKITTTLPAVANCARMAIAVSAATPNNVYLIAAKTTSYDLEGLYKSTDAGATFTKLTVSSAIIGTQGFYALSIAANPVTANEIVVGGLDVWKCANVPNMGTASFTQTSYWSGGSPYVHADIHELEYTGASTYYVMCDGGIFKTTNGGSSYSDLSNGLQISQMYGFGQSATNANVLLQGWQDNGTNRLNGTSWSRVIGGDGMKAFISHGNDQNQWGSLYYATLEKSTNGGASFSQCTSGITEFVGYPGPGPWVTEFNEDPTTANTLYCGISNVFKSIDGGSSWNKLGTVSTNTIYVTAIAAAPTTNGQVILTSKGGVVYRTTDGGTTWNPITNLPNAAVTDIAFHPTNPNKAWVTYSGFSNTTKVYQTIDQGVTWTNISTTLPNIPVNCIAVDKNGNDALYIGTDAGVFYKDASSAVWQPFFNGLPNVHVTQLEIFYSGSKIRASTFGRGMWESSLYAPGAYAPSANFTANSFAGCPGLGVQFTDYSVGTPSSWNWAFQGGNPATSTTQNPFVAYNTPGTYSVSLTATNTNGSDTKTYTNYITVGNSTNAAPVGTDKKFCGAVAITLSVTPSVPGNVRWWNQSAGGAVVGTGNTYTTPATAGTKTYYVDEAFPSGSTFNVGPASNAIGAGGMFTGGDIRGLYFDVLEPVVINSVQVYCNSAGPRTIEIVDPQGNTLDDTTITLTANPSALQTVAVNFNLYPGKDYMMKFRGTVDCYRNNAGAVYPYASSAINITGNNASGSPGYYYYFYNWSYTKVVCNTSRTAITAMDTCIAIGVNELYEGFKVDVFPNPSKGEFTTSFNLKYNDSYTIKIISELGQIVYEEALPNFSGAYSKKMNLSTFGTGVYLYRISNSKNQTVKQVVVN